MKNEKNTWKSITVIAVVLSVLAIGMVGAASAKSLYVIADHHTAQFDAYKINPDCTVAYQVNYALTVSTAPGGLAIDDDSATLFVTSEGSNNVELVDARTMTSLGFATAPGATNLAGIDVDEASNTVYTIDRRTDDLYAYNWSSAAKTLTLKAGYPVNLTNCSGAFGIAVNKTGDILYVADGDAGKIRGYNTTTWAEVQTFTPSQPPVGIAVDSLRGFLYTSTPNPGCATNSPQSNANLLIKINITTGAETNVNMGHGGMGIAVDCATGCVYVTGGCTGDDLSVWNTTTPPFTQVQTTGDIGDPCGVCIPQREIEYKPTAVPALTPIGLIALVGLLSVIAAMSIKIRKRRG